MTNNGIVWDEKRMIYFFIPKNACTTIKKLLADAMGLRYNSPHHAPFKKVPPFAAAQYHYTTFAVVRNPYDRLVSLYRDKIRPGYRGHGFKAGVENYVLGRFGKFREDMTFKEFVKVALSLPLHDSDPHILPQYLQLPKEPVDVLMRFENIRDELPVFLKKYGIDAQIPQMNRTIRVMPWQERYDDETRALATQYYQQDLQQFEYDFETDHRRRT